MEGEPLELLKLLADSSRLKVFAALVLGASQTPAIAERAGLSVKETIKVLSRLESGGVVRREGVGWRACPERLQEAVAAAVPGDTGAGAGATGMAGLAGMTSVDEDLDPAEAAVLRVFFRNGRLTQIPAQHGKRMVVLDRIARAFEPGIRYPEQDVNDVLSRYHPDYAALRRYLVDAGFLGRAGGVYWRTGGTFIV